MDCFDAEAFLHQCSAHPGVYRMLDAEGRLLYVGKARNLRQRLASYLRSHHHSPKTAALVARISRIETTVTGSETDALLLEQTLIKQCHPPYNILLRDDKSYPYLLLSAGTFPRLGLYRGARREKGQYFGPYPSTQAVKESLHLLQKAFGVRQCEDSYFRRRQRPCLQYQIKRCKGPCVGLITAEEYAHDVHHTRLFLEGRSTLLHDELVRAMEAAVACLDFEVAAWRRDQIALLRRVQSQHSMESGSGDIDVVAAALEEGSGCVHLMRIRGGQVVSSRHFFPHQGIEEHPADLLRAFLEQYYLDHTEYDWPAEIIVSQAIVGAAALSAAIGQRHGVQLKVSFQVRGIRARWQRLAQANAQQALASQLKGRQQQVARFGALSDVLARSGCSRPLRRLECFDVSHTQGEATVASCVVFGQKGPLISEYRRYNIEGVAPGDDYAAMRQALWRRFKKASLNAEYPDLLLIDGGKGQLRMAQEVLVAQGITDTLLLGVAKGMGRKPGLETLFLMLPQPQKLLLSMDDPALHLIQSIRDEAHRFAVTGHRARRGQRYRKSSLEGIAGVGPVRRRALLQYFGGLQELRRASADEIAKTPGISRKLAEQVYASLHPE